MPELARWIEQYREELARGGASPHTVAAYASDLHQFLEFLSPPETAPPEPQAIDLLILREWLAALYRMKLAAVTIRRKLAAVRGLYRFLLREGVVRVNIGRLVRTPKAPQKLPEVMTPDQVNTLIDGVAADKLERPFPARDRAIFELLYGCGVRVSELAGLNLEDVDRAERWLRVRGKGRKERQVPLPGQAAGALERYLAERPVVREERAVFLAEFAASSSSTPPSSAAIHPSIRTASGTLTPLTCWPTAPICAPFRSCWATPGSPPRKSTRKFLSPT
jgi:site-specific recombinase XerD